MSCYKLVKKGTPDADLKRINFKLGVPEYSFESILSSDLWPVNVAVRPFRFFRENIARSSNSLAEPASNDRKSIKIYFHNASGLRTKSEDMRLLSSQLDYDVFVIIETWLNEKIFDAEFFDLNRYDVFRKDRDAVKTGCCRGGGMLIASRCELQASSVALKCTDSMLDQLCVRLKGASGLLYLCASYIPPASEDCIYCTHVDNIIALQSEISAHQLCVLGDFNLSNITWTYFHNNMYLTPSNISSNTESYLVDNLLRIDLPQVNGFSNSLNQILDLIFVSDNI
ncbi:PREDICTED: uncharacterized protein LOC108358512 [Rhagoletis zephyria]|uniref:uncharacterized protein LOC108358512 n=1 Tax=Rhagoletis zephyria TaxID=28612 RepID=UPI0008114F92|nr:PREDICTED: uncharacterized protein LOC108358512 [Rhagoletis zephyria]